MPISEEQLKELVYDLDDGAEDLEDESVSQLYNCIEADDCNSEQLEIVGKALEGFIERRLQIRSVHEAHQDKGLELAINSLFKINYLCIPLIKYLKIVDDRWVEYKHFIDSAFNSDDRRHFMVKNLYSFYFASYENLGLNEYIYSLFSTLSNEEFHNCVNSYDHAKEAYDLFPLVLEREGLEDLPEEKLRDVLRCLIDDSRDDLTALFREETIPLFKRIISRNKGLDTFLEFLFQLEYLSECTLGYAPDNLDEYIDMIFDGVSSEKITKYIVERANQNKFSFLILSILQRKGNLDCIHYLHRLPYRESYTPMLRPIYDPDDISNAPTIFGAIGFVVDRCGLGNEEQELYLLSLAEEAESMIYNYNHLNECDLGCQEYFIVKFIENGGYATLFRKLKEGDPPIGLLDFCIDNKLVPESHMDDTIKFLMDYNNVNDKTKDYFEDDTMESALDDGHPNFDRIYDTEEMLSKLQKK